MRKLKYYLQCWMFWNWDVAVGWTHPEERWYFIWNGWYDGPFVAFGIGIISVSIFYNTTEHSWRWVG